MKSYSVSDLDRWGELDFSPPARVAVFGDPVMHSRSPEMHNPGLQAAGIDAQYVRLHVLPNQLPAALAGLKANDFFGTNVTIPHKAAIANEMDELTPSAKKIGVVNTVKIDGDRFVGHNTDGPGFQRAVEEEFGVELQEQRVLILGAGGGAGRAAAVQCAILGCPYLVLANRTVAKAEALAEELATYYPEKRLAVSSMDQEALTSVLDSVDVIVNGTSIGMNEDDPALIRPEDFHESHLVYDMVYAPSVTRLMAEAQRAGAKAANGLSMLLWQGVIAFEFWFDREAPVEAMRDGLFSATAYQR